MKIKKGELAALPRIKIHLQAANLKALTIFIIEKI